MKKTLILFVASMMMLAGAKAEEATDLVATLNHDGKMLAYYGQGALKDAYTAARDGDIITLSAGTFTGVDMKKNITLRGVGALDEPSTGNRKTSISGKIHVTLQNNDYEFVAEGIYFSAVDVTSVTQKECTFSKSYFSSYFESSYDMAGINFGSYVYAKVRNCVVNYDVVLYKGFCSNCVINRVKAYSGTAPIVLQNCVIKNFTAWQYYNFDEDVLTNCILIGTSDPQILSSSNDVHNCVLFSRQVKSTDVFKSITNDSNMIVEDRENFFKNTNVVTKTVDDYGDATSYGVNADPLGTDWASGLYELSDDAKQLYKGDDGTVVGVWGGTTPFDFVPNNPRLSKCEIVPRVGDDGKLNITIEVAQ